MSTNELRKAAETLRARASRATDSPWHGVGYSDGRIEVQHFPEGTSLRVPVADGYRMEDAAYISTMRPGVGLALADWLDDAAARWYHHVESAPSITLARLINGGAS